MLLLTISNKIVRLYFLTVTILLSVGVSIKKKEEEKLLVSNNHNSKKYSMVTSFLLSHGKKAGLNYINAVPNGVSVQFQGALLA